MPAILRAPRLGKLHSTGWPGGGGPAPISGGLVAQELFGDLVQIQSDLPLTIIGVPTPEQISLFLPVPDSVPYTATATCEYKRTGDATWIQGHPLYRIRNDMSSGVFGDTLKHGFAWPIIDLQPGTSYDVKVTKTVGVAVTTHLMTTSTRALPGPAGPPNKTASGDSQIRSQISSLVAGDVLEIANGTHVLSPGYLIAVNLFGTVEQPIVIRGQSRTGTILKRNELDALFLVGNLSNVIFENMTLQCLGINNGGSGPAGESNPAITGLHVGGQPWSSTNITLRNLIVNGVDRFFFTDNATRGTLVYNNTAQGNNPWVPNNQGPGNQNTWGDDGVHFPGEGNCAFQNSISGFGDAVGYCSGASQGAQVANACHFYRNDVRNSCDDSAEVDDAEACCTFYDNRVTNAANIMSADSTCGGPFLCARNIYLNVFRMRHLKWQDTNSTGNFVYNNTIVTTKMASLDPGDNGDAHLFIPGTGVLLRSYGIRNNVYVSSASELRLIRITPIGHDPVDWSHNSWFPNGNVEVGDAVRTNVQNMVAANLDCGSVFSGGAKFFASENVTVGQPWVTPIPLTTTTANELLGNHVPVPLHPTLKNTGVAIPGITDGFFGAAPDRGAVIEGRPLVAYGDQTGASMSIPAWVPTAAYQWADVPGTIWTNYVRDDGTGIVPAMTSNDPGPQTLYTAQWQFGGPAYSKKNHEFWMFGGGHAGTTVNLVTRYVLHQASPAVVVACHATLEAERKLWCGPANYDTYYVTHSYWPDGKPYCPHSYLNNLYDDTRDEFFSFPIIAGIATSGNSGASMSGSGETRPDVIALTRAGVWRADGFYPDVPPSAYDYMAEGSGIRATSSDGSALFYWITNTNSPRYGLNKLVFATNSHVHVGGTVPGANRWTMEEHNGKHLFMRGPSPGTMQAWYCSSATGSLTSITMAGDITVGSGMSLYGLVWAENLNAYFAMWVSATMSELPGEGAEGDITNIVISKLVPSGASNMTVTTMPIATGSGRPTRGGALTGFAYDPLYQCLIMALCPLKNLKAIKVT